MADPYAAFSSPVPAASPPPAAAQASDPYASFSSPAQPGGVYAARPLTIHANLPTPGPEIQVDPSDPSAVARAYNTLDENNAPGKASSAVAGAMQGASFNFGDENRGLAAASGMSSLIPGANIVGGIRMGAEALAPGTFGHSATDRYDQQVSQARAENEIAQQANPGSYFAGEIGGGLVTLPFAPELAPFKAAKEANVATKIAATGGNLATTGGAYGALAGAGGAQDGLENRAVGALQGGAVGAVVNPAFGSLASGIVGAARGTGAFLRKNVMARNNPQALADEVIAGRMQADGDTPAAIVNKMTDAPAPVMQPNAGAAVPQGPRAPNGLLTAADVGGKNLQDLAGTVGRIPGEAKTEAGAFIDARQFGSDAVPSQHDRAQAAVTRMMGGKNLASDAVEQITAKRSAEAAPLYKIAHESNIDYTSPQGQALLEDINRVPSSARSNANNILKVSDKSGTQMIFDPTPDENGMHKLLAAPNPRQWDYIKQGLDQLIEAHTDKLTGRVDVYGHALAELKRDLLRNLDEAVPAYKAARKVFAGHSEMIDAVRAGADAFSPSTSAEEMAKALKGMHSAAEKEAYRMAAAKSLKDRLSKVQDGHNKVSRITGSPELRAKVALIAPDEASQMQLMFFVNNETKMTMLRTKMAGNSATAERIAADTGLTENMQNVQEGIHAVHNLARMNVSGLMLQAARHLQKISPELRSAVLEEVRKVILNNDPAGISSFEERMRKAALPEQSRQAVIGTVRNALNKSTRAVLRAGVGQSLQQTPGTQPGERDRRLSPPAMH